MRRVALAGEVDRQARRRQEQQCQTAEDTADQQAAIEALQRAEQQLSEEIARLEQAEEELASLEELLKQLAAIIDVGDRCRVRPAGCAS